MGIHRVTARPSGRPNYFRIGLGRFMALTALAGLLLAYAGSYYRLSRRGMAEAGDYGIDGFLYVSSEGAVPGDVSQHCILSIFYAPLNWADRAVFGTPAPCICVMTLSE